MVIATAGFRHDSIPSAVQSMRSLASSTSEFTVVATEDLSMLAEGTLASYDVVTAGPRFAVTGHGHGVENLADEEDGLVSLPFDFRHEQPAAT